MAIIQTIRDKYAKVAGGVVVLALVGFIIGGTDVRNIFGPSTNVAVINGKKIDIKDFDNLLNQYTQQYKANNKIATLDEETDARLRAQIWDEIVKDEVLNDIYEKLGITVSKAELEDLLTGDFLDPIIKQQFTDPQTGAIDRVNLEQNISNFRTNPDFKADWINFQNDIIKRRKQSKFTNLIAASIYVPKFVLDSDYLAKNATATAQYVNLPYSLIPDSEVKTTDEELLTYMNKNPKMFISKQDNRSIEYVSFNIAPNSEDTAQVLNALNEIKDEFIAKTHQDSLVEFISYNSAVQTIPTFESKDKLAQLPVADELWNAPTNTIVGPFYESGMANIAKIVERATLPDSVTYRHIVVVSENGGQKILEDAEAKAKMDSAIAMLNSGVAFDSVVTTYSDDKGILQNGGTYTNTVREKTSLPNDLGTFLFTGKAGDKKLLTLDQGQFKGYQYIEIISQAAPVSVAKIAIVSKDLSPSSEAFSQAYSDATIFLKKVNESNDFNKAALESALAVLPGMNIAKNSSIINGLGASKELSKWAYTAKLNDISPIITVGEKYVVAKLTAVQEKGKIELNENTRQTAEFLVKKEKKAKLLIEQSKGIASLDELATKYNQTVGIAENISLSSSFAPSIGNEGKVIGYIFSKGLNTNTKSNPIPGNNGVYYVNVIERNIHTSTDDNTRDIKNERRIQLSPLQNSLASQVINGLVEKAEVKDNRELFY